MGALNQHPLFKVGGVAHIEAFEKITAIERQRGVQGLERLRRGWSVNAGRKTFCIQVIGAIPVEGDRLPLDQHSVAEEIMQVGETFAQARARRWVYGQRHRRLGADPATA